MNTPTGRREALEVLTRWGLSQREACRYLGLSRRVATYELRQPEKDRHLSERLLAASPQVPRFGYRRMAAWLAMGVSRVRRMWRTLNSIGQWCRIHGGQGHALAARCSVGPAFIAPGSPWQNGFVESFNGKLRDELLNREWFRSRAEAKLLIERWRQFYNERRPHSAHRYQPPATVRRAWQDSTNIGNRPTA